MFKIKSNRLNAIVNIQHGIGFDLIEGKVGIELSFFNQTQRSRIVEASRNRLNFNEEFTWNIDRVFLKYCRSINEIVKIECFRIPDISYGNIYRRQRIGHVIIKLKEFQIVGYDWDQNISVRNYKLQGCSSHYALRIVLIIQEDIPGNINNESTFNNKSGNLTKYIKQSIENKKQETKNQQIRQTNIENRTKENTNKGNINKDNKNKENKNNVNTNKANTINKANINNGNTTNNENKNKNTGNTINKGNINNENINKLKIKDNKMNQINEKDENYIKKIGFKSEKDDLQETIKKYGNLLNNMQNKTQKREMPYEVNSTKNTYDQSIKSSFESLKTYEHNDCKLSELLTHCIKHAEEWIKIMKRTKKEVDTNILRRSSSNSSIQTESDLEQPVIMIVEFIKKLCCLTESIFKKNKTKISQEVVNLKNASSLLSEFCNEFTNQIRNE